MQDSTQNLTAPGSSLVGPALAQRTPEELRLLRMVFQNPDSALNHRHSVRHIINRALTKLAGLHGAARESRLTEIVRSVRMEPSQLPMRPANPPSGCVFHTRCHRRLTDGRCETVEPALREVQPRKFLRCHLPVEQLARLELTEAAEA